MAAPPIHIAELVGRVKAAPDESTKVEALAALKRALQSESSDQPTTLDAVRVGSWLLPDLIPLQSDGFVAVRRSLAAILGCLAVNFTGVPSLQPSVACLQKLLTDAAPPVVCEAALAFSSLLKGTLALIAAKPHQADAQDVWEQVHRLQESVCEICQQHTHNCVRIAGAKLAEQIVLLYTSDSAPAVPGVPEAQLNKLRVPEAAKLAQEADALLRWLLEPLRPANAPGLPASRVMVHITAAWSIAIARPNLIGKVLPALLLLAREGGYQASNSPNAVGRSAADVSVGNALRGGLAAVMRARAPSSVPWRERMVAALQAIGAGDTANHMLKYIERQEWKERKASQGRDKRPAEEAAAGQDDSAKRARTAVPAGLQPNGPGTAAALAGGAPQVAQRAGIAGVAAYRPVPMPAAPAPAVPLLRPVPVAAVAAVPVVPAAPPPPLEPWQVAAQQQAAAQASTIITAAAQVAAGQPPLITPPTELSEITQALKYVDAAMRSDDPALVEVLLNSIAQAQPYMLADLVLLHLPLLPAVLPQHLWPPAPAPPAAVPPPAPPAAPYPGRTPTPPLPQLAGYAAPGTLQQQWQAPGGQPPGIQQQPFGAAPMPGMQAGGVHPAQQPVAQQQQLLQLGGGPVAPQPTLVDPRRRLAAVPPAAPAEPATGATPDGAMQTPGRARGPLPPLGGPACPPRGKATNRAPVVPASAVAAALPALKPIRLDTWQAVALRQAALQRLMALPPRAPPGCAMRRSVLVRLAAQLPIGDASVEHLLRHALQHYYAGGAELVQVWLNALFVQHCPLPQMSAADEGGSAVPTGLDGGGLDAEGDEAMCEAGAEPHPAERGIQRVDAAAESGDAVHGVDDGGGAVGSAAGSGPGAMDVDRGAGDEGDPRVTDAAAADLTGTQYEAVLLAVLERAREHAITWHAQELRRYSQRLRDAASKLQQQCAAMAPLPVPARVAAGLEPALAAGRQLAGNARWLGPQGKWLSDEGETLAADMQQHALMQAEADADEDAAAVVSELAQEVCDEVEGVQALMNEIMHQLGIWHQELQLGLPAHMTAVAPPPDVPRPILGIEIRDLLKVAPSLPLQGVTSFLRDLLASGGKWTTLALICAWDAIELRPPARDSMLALVLDTAEEPAAETRSAAVRLLTTKLYHKPALQPTIVTVATLRLWALVPPQQSLLGAAVSAQASPTGAGPAPGAEPATAGQLSERPALGGAALPSEGSARAPADAGAGAAAVLPTMTSAQSLPLLTPAGSVGATTASAAAPAALSTEPSVADCERKCALYMNLVTNQPDLLAGLLDAFARGGPNLRAAISQHAGGLACALGASHPTLLTILRGPPPAGSEDLVLTMLHALSDKSVPPGSLVDACKAWYHAVGDPRVIVPVAFTLGRPQLVALLPAMIRQLQPTTLKKLYKTLTIRHALPFGGGEVEPLYSAPDLLLLLHTALDPARDHVPLKALMGAVDTALHQPDVFPMEVMRTAIQAMEVERPLPRMFMRTVIQALKAAPRLRMDIGKLLERLVQRKVWLDKDQWRGFLLCADHMRNDAYVPLLQLPEVILEVTLMGPHASESARGQSVRFGLPPGCHLPWPSAVRLAGAVTSNQLTQQQMQQVNVTHVMRSMMSRILEIHKRQEEAAAKRQAAAAAGAGPSGAKAEPGVKPEPGVKAEPGAQPPAGGIKAEVKQERQQAHVDAAAAVGKPPLQRRRSSSASGPGVAAAALAAAAAAAAPAAQPGMAAPVAVKPEPQEEAPTGAAAAGPSAAAAGPPPRAAALQPAAAGPAPAAGAGQRGRTPDRTPELEASLGLEDAAEGGSEGGAAVGAGDDAAGVAVAGGEAAGAAGVGQNEFEVDFDDM